MRVVACTGVMPPWGSRENRLINKRGGALLQLQLIVKEYDWLASSHIEVPGTMIGCELFDNVCIWAP